MRIGLLGTTLDGIATVCVGGFSPLRTHLLSQSKAAS
jgi:hypothetical protein